MAISLKAVKAVAFGLGGLLVLGNILVVYALVRGSDETPVEAEPVPMAQTPLGFDPLTLPVKPGSQIIGTSVSDTRLVVHLRHSAQWQEELIVIDLTNGKILGELRLETP